MLNVRWMTSQDMVDVLRIDDSCVTPLGEKALSESASSLNAVNMVVEYEGRIVGFAVYTLGSHSAMLRHICVRPSFRRQGAATALLQDMLSKRNEKRDSAVAFVNEELLPAHMLLKKCGFEAVGVSTADEGDSYVFINSLSGLDSIRVDKSMLAVA